MVRVMDLYLSFSLLLSTFFFARRWFCVCYLGGRKNINSRNNLSIQYLMRKWHFFLFSHFIGPILLQNVIFLLGRLRVNKFDIYIFQLLWLLRRRMELEPSTKKMSFSFSVRGIFLMKHWIGMARIFSSFVSGKRVFFFFSSTVQFN